LQTAKFHISQQIKIVTVDTGGRGRFYNLYDAICHSNETVNNNGKINNKHHTFAANPVPEYTMLDR